MHYILGLRLTILSYSRSRQSRRFGTSTETGRPITTKESSPFYQDFKSLHSRADELLRTFVCRFSHSFVLNTHLGFINSILNNLMPTFPLSSWEISIAMLSKSEHRIDSTRPKD